MVCVFVIIVFGLFTHIVEGNFMGMGAFILGHDSATEDIYVK